MQTHDSKPAPKLAIPSRRSFLKGIVIAAATPTVALAPALIEQIGSLLGQHTTLEELYSAADAREAEIGKDPNKPAYPHILAGEFGPYRSGMYPRDKALFTEATIIALFDRERGQVDLWRDIWSPKQSVDLVAEANKRQDRALDLFRLRTSVYESWCKSSGYADARHEMIRLGRLISKTEDAILAYRPATLDDVRMKTSFLIRVHGDSPPVDLVQAFMASLTA